MKLLIKFPTRNRPDKFLRVLETYVQKLDDKDTKIVVSCDLDDTSMNNSFIKEVLEQYPNVSIYYGENKTKIEAINADMKDVDFDIVL